MGENIASLVQFGGNVARAGRWQLVDVDEETPLRIARVEGEHAVVDVLLDAGAAIARSQCAASGFGEQTGLDALGLRVVMDVLDDNSPFAQDVGGADWAGVFDVAGADETFTADPVALVELLSVVLTVVKVVLSQRSQTIDQIVS